MLKLIFGKSFDYFLFALVLILVILGIVTIYSSTYGVTNQYFFAQLIFAGVGIVASIIFAFLDYKNLGSFSVAIYVAGIIFLIVVLVLGKSVSGATRWISLGFFRLQPSEIFKMILIIVLAKYLGDKKGEIGFRDIACVFLLTVIPMGLVLIQPDFGTALVYFAIAIIMLFVAGMPRLHIFVLSFVFAVLAPIFWFFILRGYQKDRLISFLNPSADPFGSGYNVLQSIISVGSGQIFGRGLGHGSQSQLNFLPISIQHTDFIFAVYAEELGFLGSILLLILLTVLIIKIFKISKIARDNFGALLAAGIGGMFLFQVLVNVGMNLGSMPVTGIPLPFLSYGGTSLLIGFIALGILQSIVSRHKKINF
jgi:rod shape determining protein RodA